MTTKLIPLVLLVLVLLCQESAKADLLGPFGTSPTTFGVDGNGLLYSTGSYGTGNLSLSGPGTRMFWYPGKAAFRAGKIEGLPAPPSYWGTWNDANIGVCSVAFGSSTTASGSSSTAFGSSTTASGSGSTAFGVNSTAYGSSSTAMGFSVAAYGSSSTAMGWNSLAFASCSTAMGTSTASGSYSTAIGSSYAGGSYSTAMGDSAASGSYATAMGGSSTASGDYSTAAGLGTTATAHSSFAAGAYNVGGGNSTSWVATDPLFEIGNGTSASARSDALVVYKNGKIKMSRQGDILMGEFGNGD